MVQSLSAYAVAALLLATALYFVVRKVTFLRKKRNRTPGDQLLRMTRDVRSVSFENLPRVISPTKWRHELHALSRQKRVGPPIVDIERTAAAWAKTLSPQLIFTQKRSKPQYLVISEVRRPRDHLAAMARRIASSLHEHSAPTLLREYRGDPKLLSAGSTHGPTESLGVLAARFPDHRLILITTGDEAVEPSSAQLRAASAFEPWIEKYLMTPRKPSGYGRTEAAFSRAGFQIVGVGKRGLRQIGELLDGEKLQDHSRYVRPPLTILGQPDQRWLDSFPPNPEMIEELVTYLQAELGPGNFSWMAACAVFPLLVPQLTEYLGVALQDNHNAPLGTEEGYIELSMLPWFREGTMPDWLRLALLRDIPVQFSSDIRQALRQALESPIVSGVGEAAAHRPFETGPRL